MLIKVKDFFAFLRNVTHINAGISDVIVPAHSEYAEDKNTFFNRLTDEITPVLDSYRTVDPAKTLLYLVREQVSPLPEHDDNARIVIGVKGCDLKALEVMDAALINDDFVDPMYKLWRDTTLIISSDCDEIGDTCHCNLVDGQPFAETGYDLNLSRVNDDYLITVGSDRGDKLLNLIKQETDIRDASNDAKNQVEKKRKKVAELLTEQNKEFSRQNNYSGLRSLELAPWLDESFTCIGCGACTHICPTCYCLILNDETEAQQFVKQRTYDSCQYNGYTRVAGGANPRGSMTKRFRNRYLCKFDYMVHNFDRLGCTGCGRCSQACAGEIDFRQVVHNLQSMTTATITDHG